MKNSSYCNKPKQTMITILGLVLFIFYSKLSEGSEDFLPALLVGSLTCLQKVLGLISVINLQIP